MDFYKDEKMSRQINQFSQRITQPRRTVLEFLEEEGIKVRAERIDRSMV